MVYIPVWESIAEALARVTAYGYSMADAQRDICRALSDGKLRAQYRVERVQTPHGFEVNRRAFGLPRGRLDQGNIIGRPCVPPDLSPDDIDWVNSRPKSPWLDKHRFVVGIAKIELSTADIIRVLCEGRTAKPASDAQPDESSLNLPVQAPEPPSPPETDIASAGQIATPRHKSSAKRDRAQRALNEVYPGGVPEKTTDMELFKALGRKLGADTPSLETVRRAAGRRSKSRK
jgi:hypothetical protein